jgi:hypothetical protein
MSIDRIVPEIVPVSPVALTSPAEVSPGWFVFELSVCGSAGGVSLGVGCADATWVPEPLPRITAERYGNKDRNLDCTGPPLADDSINMYSQCKHRVPDMKLYFIHT